MRASVRATLLVILVLGLAVPALACSARALNAGENLKDVERALDNQGIGYTDVQAKTGSGLSDSHQVMAAMILQSNGLDPDLVYEGDAYIADITLDNGEVVAGVIVPDTGKVLFYKN